MSDKVNTVVGAAEREQQVMVSLPDIYEAARSATVDGAVAFKGFYEIVRRDYPQLPQWPEEEEVRPAAAAQNARTRRSVVGSLHLHIDKRPDASTLDQKSDAPVRTTAAAVRPTNSSDHNTDDDENDDVPLALQIERRPPLTRSSNNSSKRNRPCGPQHSANQSAGYVDILTPIVEKLEEDLQKLNLREKYESKGGGVPRRETWVPPPVEPGSPEGYARGSYSRYYEYISTKELERRDGGVGGGEEEEEE